MINEYLLHIIISNVLRQCGINKILKKYETFHKFPLEGRLNEFYYISIVKKNECGTPLNAHNNLN